MKSATKQYIDQLLFDYPTIDKEIERVIEEIKYPIRYKDENDYLPGSNLPSLTLENSVIRVVDSKRISLLKNTKNSIEQVLEELNDNEREFIEHYYFAKPRTKTIQGIAMAMGYSTSNIYAIRTVIREKVAQACHIHY